MLSWTQLIAAGICKDATIDYFSESPSIYKYLQFVQKETHLMENACVILTYSLCFMHSCFQKDYGHQGLRISAHLISFCGD